ncbi:MAG: low molecular weight phosphotyrosine protein phosphatase [Prevotella sp.]|nr:low molecular weight phosphotyrosine protein phosphatase [Alistipes senegalensis]MCM1358422.1 low molecular weight phosphotyrosine protein phosphatase [Prevotella sp.]MCM1473322.1 low molecular weight phosphotyrosine protein phosphatase [Muribaculaceae bacterium]
MKKLVSDAGLHNKFYITSGATSSETIHYNGIGSPVYPPAKSELRKHGIGCDGKLSVQLKKSDYENYDYFIGMDTANIRNMKKILGDDKKIYKLLTFAGRSDDVDDPWYTGDFRTAYDDIYSGCSELLKKLTR